MNCRWCGCANIRDSARFCSTCAAPLLDGVSLVNYPSGAWLHGRYQIRKLLGAGAMGTVYGALDNALPGRRVAIKELDPQRIGRAEDRQPAEQMFRDEAQTLARLDHPNIPKVSDYFVDGVRQYQVMDFVDGKTVDQILSERHTLPEHLVITWAKQVCEALNYLHTLQPAVIFRDLKPSNIMVDVNGHVKVIDFGIARRVKIGKRHDTQLMGTPGFAPPEQYGSGQTDARSDIYALCATMYVMLTGYDPAANAFQLPDIRTLAPVSENTAQVISTGLAYNPDQRWQTVQQLATRLTGVPLTPSGTRPMSGRASGSPTQLLSTKLLLLTKGWSNAQFVAALAALTALIAATMYLLVPLFKNYPEILTSVDAGALVAPIVYASVRRRYFAGIAQMVIAGVVTVVTQFGMGFYGIESVVRTLGLVAVSGVLVEVWLAWLPVPHGQSPAQWQREVVWLALLAVIATVSIRIAYGPDYAFRLTVLVSSLCFGVLGWLIGDTLHLTLKQKGVV